MNQLFIEEPAKYIKSIKWYLLTAVINYLETKNGAR